VSTAANSLLAEAVDDVQRARLKKLHGNLFLSLCQLTTNLLTELVITYLIRQEPAINEKQFPYYIPPLEYTYYI